MTASKPKIIRQSAPAVKCPTIRTNGKDETVYELQDIVTGATYYSNRADSVMANGVTVCPGKGTKAPAARKTKRQNLLDWMRGENSQIKDGGILK